MHDRLQISPARAVVLGLVLCLAACSATGLSRSRTHGGVQYSFPPISPSNRIEMGKDGGLMFDSPQLTVDCRSGRLTVNGKDAGPVAEGDHVEITSLNTVLVNGQRRGDSTTGAARNQQRIEHTVKKVEG